jgi:hypothetical protein
MTDKTDREIMYQAMVALDSKNDMTKAEWRYLQYHAFNDLRERLAKPDPRNQRGVGMTDRKLLEQAHDALYKEDRISGYANYGKLRKDLRERLAQPDPLQRFTDVQQEIEAALAPEQEQIAQAVQTVIQAMQDDPGYAWAWHCNIAMAFVDAGGDRYTANQGAARFLEMFAKVQPAHELPAPEQEPMAVIKRNEAGQITMQTPDGNPFDMSKYIGAKLHTAPPEQESLAWLYPEGLAALKAGKCWTAYGTKQDKDNNIPIYTTPPEQERREWQGLTDEEEIRQTADQRGIVIVGEAMIAFARAIEAKLKEKNT